MGEGGRGRGIYLFRCIVLVSLFWLDMKHNLRQPRLAPADVLHQNKYLLGNLKHLEAGHLMVKLLALGGS